MQGEHVVRRVAEEHDVLFLRHGIVDLGQRQGLVHFLQLHGFGIAVRLGADLLHVGRGPAGGADPDLALAVAI